jgi:muconolactone D-isomerase
VEFLVRIQVNFPPELPAEQLKDVLDREAVRGRQLQAAGTIVRIWRIPGRRENVGIWSAETVDELHEALMSLPAFPWVDAHVTALATHYLEAAS